MEAREIKFRVWHKKEKRMFNVFAINFEEKFVACRLNVASPLYFPFDEIELLQFAKSWDIEHTEIYEEDILKGTDGFLYTVKNNGIKFYLVAMDITDRGLMNWTLDMFDLSLLKIIGNTNKNSELLKRGKG